jgi:glycogen operon protein
VPYHHADRVFATYYIYYLNGEALPQPDARGQRIIDDSFLLCFNAGETPVDFVTPNTEYAQSWQAVIDTADPAGDTELAVQAGQAVTVMARSLIILQKSR